MIPRTQTELLKRQIATETELKRCAFRDGFFECLNRCLSLGILLLFMGLSVVLIIKKQGG